MSEKEELTTEEVHQVVEANQSPQEEVEQSYIQSDGHFWNETRLDPYSAQRQIAAQALGLRFGSLTREDLGDDGTLSSYPGLMQDAIIILYLCYPRGPKLKDGIEESYAACDSTLRRAVRRRMLDWAESQGIEMGSVPYQKAVELMIAIIKETKANQFRPAPAEGRKPPGN